MAAFVYREVSIRRSFRRQRVFLDRQNPLEIFNDSQVLTKFRLTRQAILDVTDSVSERLELGQAR